MPRPALVLGLCLAGLCAGCRAALPLPAAVGGLTARTPPVPACAPRLVRDVGGWGDISRWPARPGSQTYVEGSASFIPNVGLGIGAGWVVHDAPTLRHSVEAHATWQFLDDEDFADDGNPAAGDLYQVRVGLKGLFAPMERRHLVFRIGAVWFQANGEPNIVDLPGNYFGGYVSAGFETDITASLSAGPELAMFLVGHEDGGAIEPVPQFTYRMIWHPGRGARCGGCVRELPPVPRGEFYAGVSAEVLPSIGWGLQAGQVVHRAPLATFAFEMLAGFQDGGSTLQFEGPGRWSQLRGGFKASFFPGCRGHLTARAGLGWVRSTGPTSTLNGTGDHFGAYVGLGYEFDVTPWLTTGPSASLMALTNENTDFDPELVPQLRWHVIVNL